MKTSSIVLVILGLIARIVEFLFLLVFILLFNYLIRENTTTELKEGYYIWLTVMMILIVPVFFMVVVHIWALIALSTAQKKSTLLAPGIILIVLGGLFMHLFSLIAGILMVSTPQEDLTPPVESPVVAAE